MRKLALALSLAVLAASGPAVAQMRTLEHRYTWYSDSLKTEIVGYTLIYCDGTTGGNGYPTQYYDEEHYDCP
jgi:hypothetical protein